MSGSKKVLYFKLFKMLQERQFNGNTWHFHNRTCLFLTFYAIITGCIICGCDGQTNKQALNINSTTRLFSQCCGKSHDILWCTDRHLTWEDCKIGRQLYMTAIFHLETKLLDLSHHVVSACVFFVHVNQDGRLGPLLKWKNGKGF